MTVPLPSPGDTDWIDWAGDIHAKANGAAQSGAVTALGERVDALEEAPAGGADIGSIVMSASNGSNDTAAISAAMDAANSAGKALFFPPGTYYCGTISKAYAPRIWAAPGTVTIAATVTSGWLWSFAGTIGSTVAVSANIARGDLHITVASTAGLAAGDLIRISDGQASYTSQPTRTQGQTVEIASVDSGTTLTLSDPAYTAFLTASTAVIAKVTAPAGARVSDVKFLNTVSSATVGLLRLTYLRDIEIAVDSTGAGAAAVRFDHCYDFRADVSCRRHFDGGAGQFGYGVEVNGASAHGQVHVRANRVRHACAGSGIDGQPGEPLDIRVTGVAHGCTGHAWDWHAQGSDITFDGCHAYGSRSYGFAIRGKRQHIHGGVVEGGYGGAWLFEAARDNRIDGLRISNTQSSGTDDASSAGGRGIRVQNATTGLTITNCELVDIARDGIVLDSTAADLTISGNVLRNVGKDSFAGQRSAIHLAGAVTRGRVRDNTITDNQGSKTTLAGITVDATCIDTHAGGNEVQGGIPALVGSGAGSVAVGGGTAVNVRDYGAAGDGVTDDTAAIQAAIDAVAAREAAIEYDFGGTVFFPMGRYRHTAKIAVPRRVYLQGESAFACKLVLDSVGVLPAQVEFGLQDEISTFCGIKSMQVDSKSKADVGVLLYGPQEGATLNEVWSLGARVGCVDVDATEVLGTSNKFVIEKCWMWTAGEAGMFGARIEGGIMSIRSTTFVGVGRAAPSGGPSGSAGVIAIDAGIVIDDLNCEHWESTVSVTRSSLDMRGVSGFASTNGLRISADSLDHPVFLQNAKLAVTGDAVVDLAAGVTLPTASSYMTAGRPGQGYGQHFRRGWIEHDSARIMRPDGVFFSLWFDSSGRLRSKQGDRASDTDGTTVGTGAGRTTAYVASNYTAQLVDAGRAIEVDAAATVTIPPNVFPAGTSLEITQLNAGQVTIAAGSGVFLRTASSLKTRAKYSVVTLRLRDASTNDWVVSGDLAPLAPSWNPTGAKAATLPNRIAASTGSLLSSGRLTLCGGLVLEAGVPINSITFAAGGTGAATPTNQWFCLVDQNLNILAKTVDDTTTAWAANTTKTLALTATYTPTAPIAVYAGIVVVAATMPTFVMLAGASTVVTGLGPAVSATANTGLTNPASLATVGALTPLLGLGYAYVS